MTKVKQTQLVLLSIAVVLFVLLYIAPKRSESPAKKAGEETKSSITTFANIESFVKTAGGMLAPELKTQHDALLNKQSFDSLIRFWDKAKRPDIASYYFEKTAAKSNSALNWFKAGDRYYYSIRFVKDVNEIPALYQSAMRCYESGLKLEPDNTDGKIMLAACYVEGSQDPMKGITMLREVEKTDSNNVKLQLNFAFFSAKSQQWDKAIARFEKVLKIDPNYIEAYLHLADAYEQQGDKTKTIEMLEKYVSNTNDAAAADEIKKYIQQLKEN
jgi:tetratricopeptide (TPR) repeat protein